MSIAIRVDNLGKRYQLGATHAGSVRELVNRGWNRMLGRSDAAARPQPLDPEAAERVEGNAFWALRDVSFEVKPGEVVGIIGRNGSGKSTLLKILSQITAPTTGRVELHGRVASLLEVGTGFHPELSGRENVFLNGAILGMTKPEIRRKFDEIVAFAEIEKFIDTPVKRYSSGMYVRLAFAVAAHLEPEILIVDEVLSVGDTGFQKKCLGKMGEVAGRGRTVLFVSHNMETVGALCQRCVVLECGSVRAIGSASDCIRTHGRYAFPGGEFVRHQTPRLVWTGVQNLAELRGLSPPDDIVIRLGFKCGAWELPKFSVDIALTNDRHQRVLHAKASLVSAPFAIKADEAVTIEYRFLSPRLAPGSYVMTVYAENESRVEFWADNIECLSISPKPYFGRSLVFDGLTAAIIPEFGVRVIACGTEAFLTQGASC